MKIILGTCFQEVSSTWNSRVSEMSKRRATTPLVNAMPIKKRKNVDNLVNPKRNANKKPEKKNIDVDTAAMVVAGQVTASLILLNPIPQGNTENQRIGRAVDMVSLTFKWVGAFATTTTGASPLRLLIVYDKQANGVALTAVNVLQADSIENPMNLAYSKRFLILVDEEVECVGTAGPQAWFRKGYRKLNLPAEFAGNGGTVTNIETGSIYALVYQTGGILTANPNSQLYTRIRYTDN